MPSSSSQRYSIVEPHPSVSNRAYIPTGRGGAGNLTRAPASVTRGSDATGPASRASIASLSHLPSKSFTTGRGGAGNVHSPSERAIFSFDEELERQLSRERHAAPVFHVGRGGAGNAYAPTSKKTSQPSMDIFADVSSRRRSSNSAASNSSSGSESGADVATRNIKKGWKKITGSAGY